MRQASVASAAVTADGIGIPRDAASRKVRGCDEAVDHPQRLLKDRISPVDDIRANALLGSQPEDAN